MSSVPLTELTDATVLDLVHALESITDGELAVDILIACGSRTVPFLSKALLHDPARSIAVFRCRVVRALGGLGAEGVLSQYLRNWTQPADPAVAMAEDAVRSAAAKELLRWPSREVFDVLLASVRQRASLGLVESLGAFGRAEAVPVLFHVLQDDICRNSAKEMLRKTPGHTKIFALRLLTEIPLEGRPSPATLRSVQSSLEFLSEMKISKSEWMSVRPFLFWPDAETVIACAEIGIRNAPAKQHMEMASNVFRILPDCNWLQESRAIELLSRCASISRSVAAQTRDEWADAGKKPDPMNPLWRAIGRFVGPYDPREKNNVA